MDDNSLLLSIRRARKSWIQTNINALLTDIIPTEESENDEQSSVQNVKKTLLLDTKQLKMNNPESIPKDLGVDLLAKYQEKLNEVRSKVKRYEAIVVQLFDKLSLADDPNSFLKTMISEIRSVPTFEMQVAELKSEIDREKAKNQEIAVLTEQYQRLKHECDEQVALAVEAAKSQASVDFEVALNDFVTQKSEALQQLKNIESELVAVREKHRQTRNSLFERESDLGNANSVRHNQLDALKNEVLLSQSYLDELTREHSDIINSGALEQYKSQISDAKASLVLLDRQIASIEDQIAEKKSENNIQRQILTNRVDSLSSSISDLQNTLESLPSPLEWQKAQRELASLRAVTSLENELSELRAMITSVEKQRLESVSLHRDAQNRLLVLQSSLKSTQSEVEHIVSSFSGESDVIKVLQSQKSMLEAASGRLDNEIRNLQMSNTSRRLDKDTWESDLAEMKRKMKSFDTENPSFVTRRAQNHEENTHEQKLLSLCISNRGFRIGFVVYILMLHILIYVVSVTRFLK